MTAESLDGQMAVEMVLSLAVQMEYRWDTPRAYHLADQMVAVMVVLRAIQLSRTKPQPKSQTNNHQSNKQTNNHQSSK